MDRAHWDDVWRGRDPDQVTWYQRDLVVSRRLIESVATPSSAVIDVGGGASRLIDHLLDAGHRDLTVVDISDVALAALRARLGARADRVRWYTGDITEMSFDRTFDVWHDRAVFHFLVDAAERERYLATLRGALAAGGHVVLATFGPDGPERCSGLPVRRYGIELMQETLGDGFRLVEHELEEHVAPSGVTQQFLYALFRDTRAPGGRLERRRATADDRARSPHGWASAEAETASTGGATDPTPGEARSAVSRAPRAGG